ncbi:MAG TPA: sugar ABC transporter ATP-binding protein [Clostridia bacterium]|nr:sugar ABC transporter ATP-binding protein [Clostridia bacterium]
MPKDVLLHFKQIKKSFAGNVVLKGVDFTVGKGEIVALAGENGAGKSTLMNILFGMSVIQSTGGFEGEVIWEGKPVKISSPDEAMHYGIGMVHQEFMLLPGFTVARNIKLNRENLVPNLVSKIAGRNYELLDEAAIVRDAQTILNRLGMDISPETRVESLPVGYKQFVEIAREISKKDLKLLVLDEPTAVLTESEAERFMACIRQVADAGISIIFISHRLDEVINLADRAVVLRDGQMVFDSRTQDTNKKQIAELMVGRTLEADSIAGINREISDDIIMSIEHLRVDMPGEYTKDINLDVHRGEILGIGGLAGQGKISISNGIFAMYPATGKVKFEGQYIDFKKVGVSLSCGLAFVSEDRKGVGLLLDESIGMNIVYTDMQLHNHYLKKIGPIKLFHKAMAEEVISEMIETLDIRCTGPNQLAGSLSGGNQQKICMARALLTKPKILFVSEPTRGIDIGAKQILLNYLRKINREQGITIVMTSSELNELRSICDRVAIITEGCVKGILKPDASAVNFALLMSGEDIEGGAE